MVVTLEGALRHHAFPGRPNYESIAKGDEAELAPLLTLAEPVCVEGRKGEDSPEEQSEDEVLVVQLSSVEFPMSRFSDLIGRRVEVSGTLLHAITGHHHTRVWLMATRLRASNRPTPEGASPPRLVARAVRLCKQIALPNSMALAPGIEPWEHMRELESQLDELLAVLDSAEAKAIEAALASKPDELEKYCLDGLQAKISSQGPVTVDVTEPVVIGFFPPYSKADEEADDGGIREGLAHVRFALEDIARCYGNARAVYRLEVTRRVTLREGPKVRHVDLPPDWRHAVGLILAKPGHEPRIVYAELGPSSLGAAGPPAAAEYFDAPACRSPK